MQLGLIILWVGMLASLFFCVRRWDQGSIYKYLPPMYGFCVGVIFAIRGATPDSDFGDFLETVLAFAAVGWILWLQYGPSADFDFYLNLW